MKKVILLSLILLFMGACNERLCVSKGLKFTLLAKFAPRDKSTLTHESTVLDIRCLKLLEGRQKR